MEINGLRNPKYFHGFALFRVFMAWNESRGGLTDLDSVRPGCPEKAQNRPGIIPNYHGNQALTQFQAFPWFCLVPRLGVFGSLRWNPYPGALTQSRRGAQGAKESIHFIAENESPGGLTGFD
jgi:hypothetical protein